MAAAVAAEVVLVEWMLEEDPTLWREWWEEEEEDKEVDRGVLVVEN